jgi:aspartyl-tRNA(Asn)/glutamyl-tRNA(Gln) amidotransferase subunit C
MIIDPETVERVARLARLALTEGDRERFGGQIGLILEYCGRLNETPLTDVPPTSHVVPITNVLRDDVVTPSLSRDEVLAQAPAARDGFFQVPRVLEEA